MRVSSVILVRSTMCRTSTNCFIRNEQRVQPCHVRTGQLRRMIATSNSPSSGLTVSE